MKKFLGATLAVAAIATTATAHAVQIVSQYGQLAGNHWAVDLTLVNSTPTTSFAGFTVYFDSRFLNLSVAASPTGWDSIVEPYDPALPANGYFDTLALNSSALPALGASRTGFRVAFDWNGVGTLGGLNYTLNDANFATVASGVTVTPVPEPETAALLAAGLGALGWMQRRRSRDAAPAPVTFSTPGA